MDAIAQQRVNELAREIEPLAEAAWPARALYVHAGFGDRYRYLHYVAPETSS